MKEILAIMKQKYQYLFKLLVLFLLVSCKKDNEDIENSTKDTPTDYSITQNNVVEETEDGIVDFKDETIVIGDDLEEFMISNQNNQLTFSKNEISDDFKKGDILFSKPTEHAPDGYSYKIISKSENNGLTTFNVESAKIEEVFDQFETKYQSQEQIEINSLEFFDAQEIIDEQLGASKRLNTNSVTTNGLNFFNKSLLKKIDDIKIDISEGGRKAKVSYVFWEKEFKDSTGLGPKVEATVSYEVYFKDIDFEIKSSYPVNGKIFFNVHEFTNVVHNLNFSLSTGGSVSKLLESDKEIRDYLVGKKIPLFQIPIPLDSTGTVNKIAVDPKFIVYVAIDWGAEGSLNIGAEYAYGQSINFGYDPTNFSDENVEDGWNFSYNDASYFDWWLNAEANMNFNIGLGVGIVMDFPQFKDENGVKAYIGGFFEPAILDCEIKLRAGVPCSYIDVPFRIGARGSIESYLKPFSKGIEEISSKIEPLTYVELPPKSFDFCESEPLSFQGDLNFGEVTINQKLTKELRIVNLTDDEINIRDIKLPDGFSSDWSKGYIAAKSEQVLQITFEPTENKNYDGIITVVSDANEELYTIEVTASSVENIQIQNTTPTDIGVVTTINLLDKFTLNNGTKFTPNSVLVDLDTSESGIQSERTVIGEGEWVYDTMTGKVTFSQDPGFTLSSTPIDFEILNLNNEVQGGGTLKAIYEIIPVAEHDESLSNINGSSVEVYILNNDYDEDGTIDPETVSLQAPKNAINYISNLSNDLIGFTIPSEGTWSYDSVKEIVTFTPEENYIDTEPTRISYTVRDNDGNESDSDGDISFDTDTAANIVVTYQEKVEEEPITEEKIFEGDVFLSSQEEVNEFAAKKYTEITGRLGIGAFFEKNSFSSLSNLKTIKTVGSLYIRFNNTLISLDGLENITSIRDDLRINGSDALTSLKALENITSVGGDLRIDNNYALTSLNGLKNITSVGGSLSIDGNDALTSLNGLENITNVKGGDLLISQNTALTSLNGLENITSVGRDLHIGDNDILTSLNGLENITSVGGDLRIGGNGALTSLNGLENITSVGGSLSITANKALTSLNGLENITNVKGESLDIINNDALTSLNGLENITSVGGDLRISYNDALTSLNAFCSIGSIDNILGNIEIANNSYNPTIEEIKASDCEQ